MCDDIEAQVAGLTVRGVRLTQPVGDEGWGLLTRLEVPGGGERGRYHPRHVGPGGQ